MDLDASPSGIPQHSEALKARLLVVIPSYNTGPVLLTTVQEVLAEHAAVWVVVDGSTDGSDLLLDHLQSEHPELEVLRLPENRGKGAAVLTAASKALQSGYTHILTFDADGQHPASFIPVFRSISEAEPGKMVMGQPVFGADAPRVRVHGRRLSNLLVRLETFGVLQADSLFGMRVYPAAALVLAFAQTNWARRYDFDPEIAVLIVWQGVAIRQISTPVKYPAAEEGGVSHFHYGKDNLWMAWMHLRLIARLGLWGGRRMLCALGLDASMGGLLPGCRRADAKSA